jgi:hypothetical protein
MNIDYLIQLLTNRLTGLALAKDQAFSAGDLERINAVDSEILDIQNTISKLKLVSNVEQAASVSSLTESQIVQRGIESIFTPTVINGSTEVLLAYNITSYATDPYHEIKIQTILENMGAMDTPEQIETYLRRHTPDSPLHGSMIYNSASAYNVDARLLMAIMELDSRYGTQGLGARTYNPGNVGNNGFEERTYTSWEAGVDAVSNWLDRHRITQSVLEVARTTPAPLIFTTVPAAAPIQTLEHITIGPDMATAVTSIATSTASTSTTTTEPIATETYASSTEPTNVETAPVATSTEQQSPTESVAEEPVAEDTQISM